MKTNFVFYTILKSCSILSTCKILESVLIEDHPKHNIYETLCIKKSLSSSSESRKVVNDFGAASRTVGVQVLHALDLGGGNAVW